MKKFRFIGLWLIVVQFVCICFQAEAQFYNGSQMIFGKNRLQFNEFLWQFYRYKHYDIYFYLGGKELAIYTAKTAESSLFEIQKRFDYAVEEPIQFVIYNKLSDLRQSNLGLSTDLSYNTGGTTHIVDGKVVLYFNGDHRHFENQIRAGIVQVMINKMMFGGNLRDVIRSSTFLTLPEWYNNGLVSYISTDWNSEIENAVKDGVLSGRYNKFNRLSGDDATLAGHSFWHFVAETYGKSVISDILYMTRVSRNVESGFLYVLGTSLKGISAQWLAYYKFNYFENSKKLKSPEGESLLKRYKKGRVYQQVKLSPDGRYAAFVTNDMGLFRIYIKEVGSKKKPKKVLKKEYRSVQKTDYSYPIIDWHPGGKIVAWIWERKGEILLSLYNTETRKTETRGLKYFDKILDFSYSSDARKFALSAVQFGQSDIFIYDIISNTYYQVTKDAYDDLHPRFLNKGRELIFSSNRENDTIKPKDSTLVRRQADMDLFMFNIPSKNKVLKRVTNSKFADEILPEGIDSSYFVFINDENGTRNRYVGRMDSSIAYVDTVTHFKWVTTAWPSTNYPRNILQNHAAPLAGKLAETYYEKGKHKIFIRSLQESKKEIGKPIQSLFKQKQTREERKQSKKNTAFVPKLESPTAPKPDKQPKPSRFEVDIDNYVFLNEDKKSPSLVESKSLPPPIQLSDSLISIETTDRLQKKKVKEKQKHSPTDPAEDTVVFKMAKQRVYELRFSANNITTQLDNAFISNAYQPYTGGGAVYFNPGLNGMFKLGASDLFEDYRIMGGFRLGFDFRSNEYFLSWQHLKKRLDRQVIFHRQSFSNLNALFPNRVQMHTLSYQLRYPFTENASITCAFLGRTDRTSYVSSDIFNLRRSNEYGYLGGLKLDFTFDNTLPIGLNLYQGLRYKIFAEFYQNVLKGRKYFTVFGADFRHYTRIHRNLIWANRIAGSTSIGPEKLLYYLGGVDNWLFPRFDRTIPVSQTENYRYQTIATNMRGFYQNVRNGNSFLALNSEVRWPIIKYLVNRPLRSDFLNNLQLIGFGDMGTAWNGLSPYSDRNTFNTRIIRDGSLTIKLKNTTDPIVYGFGMGARSRILGYFIRFDYAWGLVDGIILKPQVHLSLSLDF